MRDPLQRLYETKLTLLAFLFTSLGLGLLFFGHWIKSEPHWQLIANWPILDIGTGLFTTGLLSVALQYFDAQDSEDRATARLQKVLASAAPAIRDAVINSFAFDPNDLARVATPETLDKIVTNGLALRLGDTDFASEIYADVRNQAISSPERLHDARIAIRFTQPAEAERGRLPGLLVTTVRWEFLIRPVYATRRFVTVSNLEEFREADADEVATSVWLLPTGKDIDAGERSFFELVDFTVDGKPRPIRRTSKQGSQIYTVAMPKEAIEANEPVRVAYTYRTVTAVDRHVLRLRVDQPTRGLSIEFDYSDTDIAGVDVLDFITSSERAMITETPASLPERQVTVAFDGWVPSKVRRRLRVARGIIGGGG